MEWGEVLSAATAAVAEFVSSGPERWYQTTVARMAFSPATCLPLDAMPLLAKAFPSLDYVDGKLVDVPSGKTVMAVFDVPGGSLLFIRNGHLFVADATGEAGATVANVCASCGKEKGTVECVGGPGSGCVVRVGSFVGILDWRGRAHVVAPQLPGGRDIAVAFPDIFPGWQEVSYTTPKALLLGVGIVSLGLMVSDVVREITKK